MQLRPREPILSVDPFKCRVWRLHDRNTSDINEHTCQEAIDSFRKHGQLVPVLGRSICGDPQHDIELIYGARRLFIARYLNLPLLVEMRELSDRDALVAMDIENRLRQDISAYERGLSYARWLRSGHFKSQEDIAHSLNVSGSQVSRLLRLSRLPAVVVDSFRSAIQIRENWGLDLMDALDDADRRPAILKAARALGGDSPRLPARDVYRKLITASVRGRKPKLQVHDRVVLDDDGAPLFRIRPQSTSIALILPVESVSADCLRRLEAQLVEILDPPKAPIVRERKQIVRLGDILPQPVLELGMF